MPPTFTSLPRGLAALLAVATALAAVLPAATRAQTTVDELLRTGADPNRKLLEPEPLGSPFAARQGDARPPARPQPAAAAADVVDAGTENRVGYAILVDSVRRNGTLVVYDLQLQVPGFAGVSRQRVFADCKARLRAVQPEDTAATARLQPLPGGASRAGREVALACALPEGPRKRWFAGFVVSSDGVVVAPHARTAGCAHVYTGGAFPRPLAPLADEDDISVFRIPGGGPWPVMPALADAAAPRHLPVTMMGVAGTAPRVGVAYAEAAGANGDDPGWPQVRTLRGLALPEGIVWRDGGAAIGLALGLNNRFGDDGEHAFVRLLPAATIRERLQRHGVQWRVADGPPRDEEAAMRLALAATIPLACGR